MRHARGSSGGEGTYSERSPLVSGATDGSVHRLPLPNEAVSSEGWRLLIKHALYLSLRSRI